MKIIYKDYLDNQITELQAMDLDEYSKEFLSADGLVKKEEMYVNNKLTRVHYYRDSNETEEDAIAKSKLYGVPFSIRKREAYGDHTIISVNLYSENQLTDRWKFLADINGFILCTQAINIVSGKPIYEQTNKYLGEYSNDPEPNYCKFIYNAEGEFQYCDYNYVRDYESEIFESDRLHMIKDKFNLAYEMYNYYLTAELLPPLK